MSILTPDPARFELGRYPTTGKKHLGAVRDTLTGFIYVFPTDDDARVGIAKLREDVRHVNVFDRSRGTAFESIEEIGRDALFVFPDEVGSE